MSIGLTLEEVEVGFERQQEEREKALEKNETKCVWKRANNADEGVWETLCKHFIWLENTPLDYGAKYCLFCGKELEEIPSELSDEREEE